MKRNRLPRSDIYSVFMLFLLFSVMSNVNGASEDSLLEIRQKSYGFSIETASHGTGLGGFYTTELDEKYQIMLQARFINIMGEGEFPIYNWYTGYYTKASEKNLLLVPLYGGVKFFPFAGQIANNFSPF